MPNPYESDALLSQYLLLHYGEEGALLPWKFGPREALEFPARLVADNLLPRDLPLNARALDLGCAVGRAAFELARHCREVIGIDYSAQFIAAAQELKRSGALEFAYVEEGEISRHTVARVPDGIERARVDFRTGDAHRLDPALGEFDVVLAANLLCRLREPRRFLDQLPGLVRPGGRLILATPFTWSTEFTPRENWLGGFMADGAPARSFDSLRQILAPDFALAATRDMPFLIREHARKFQWGVTLASTWQRRQAVAQKPHED